MNVNFIITCHDKEEYWPVMSGILSGYKTIVPKVALCYNGFRKNFPSNFWCLNKGKEAGEFDLIRGGFKFIKENKNPWIKLSIDSWMLDESKVIEILEAMKSKKAHYAGAMWDNDNELSTDIFFASPEYMKVFCEGTLDRKIEKYAFEVAKKLGPMHLIPERGRAAREAPGRWSVPALGWCMFHDLQKNIDFMKEYRLKNGDGDTTRN
jgi:hypothetical protein